MDEMRNEGDWLHQGADPQGETRARAVSAIATPSLTGESGRLRAAEVQLG
jgi:hypothetical protein